MIKKTKQGYMYVEVTNQDCINWGGLGICDNCGKSFDKGYLVFVLSSCICEECFNDWINVAKGYEEDLYFQSLHAESWFKNYLGGK